MQITTIGLDLAKNLFQVHAVDGDGQVVLRRRLARAEVVPFFATLAPCRIGVEACGTAHYWARQLIALGHEVRLMPAAYVKPYVKRGKNDAADAEAICEAVTRPTMRFVPVKSAEAQSILMASDPGSSGAAANDAGECLARPSRRVGHRCRAGHRQGDPARGHRL